MLWNVKSKDATFQGIWRFSVDWYFTADLQIRGKCFLLLQIIVNFSKFLSVRNYTIHNMWLVQDLKFKTATFQFFFSQSYQNHVMLQLRDLHKKHVRLSTTSWDASVGLCRELYFSKEQVPFWIRWDFHHKIWFARSCWVTNRQTFIFESVLSRIRSNAELFSHNLFPSWYCLFL